VGRAVDEPCKAGKRKVEGRGNGNSKEIAAGKTEFRFAWRNKDGG
jgi:hypothetical protein